MRGGRLRGDPTGIATSLVRILNGLIIVALWNTADHYIFMLWFVLLLLLPSFFLSSPNLSHRRLDGCHTSTHVVALVRI